MLYRPTDQEAGRTALAARIVREVTVNRRDDLLNMPYSHAILECTK